MIGWTLVCLVMFSYVVFSNVSIHLECLLDKARVYIEISLLGLQWMWHTNSNSVTIWFLNIGSVNAINVDSIRINNYICGLFSQKMKIFYFIYLFYLFI